MSPLLAETLWLSFVGAVVRIVVEHWPVFVAFALLLTGAGFTYAQDRRAREQCARDGHRWQSSEIGLRCLRCGERVW